MYVEIRKIFNNGREHLFACRVGSGFLLGGGAACCLLDGSAWRSDFGSLSGFLVVDDIGFHQCGSQQFDGAVEVSLF